jgi:hypothetical protein
MLAGREGIFPSDTEIGRRAKLPAIHENACTARIDVSSEIPDALPEGHWRKKIAAQDQRGTE